MDKKIELLIDKIINPGVHGKNVITKLKQYDSFKPDQQKQLETVVCKYIEWHDENNKLVGYTDKIISKRVELLNKYKTAIEDADFTSQSKLHSSILEEFMFYLFKDLICELNHQEKDVKKKEIYLGDARAYCNMYFCPKSLKDFLVWPRTKINVKDQDFAIYRKVLVSADEKEEIDVNVPVVSIEVKTYIDKTMLEGSIATAEKIKSGNPYCLFIVVSETYDVSFDVDPAYSRIDQIFILRKRKYAGPNPIYDDVVKNIFTLVKQHLNRDWSNIEKKLSTKGEII